MEFYFNAKPTESYDADIRTDDSVGVGVGVTKKTTNYNVKDCQISPIHCSASLLAACRYSTGVLGVPLYNANWRKINKLVLKFPEDAVDQCISTNLLKVKADNCIEGLIVWLREVGWDMDISGVSIGKSDIVVMCHSKIPNQGWNCLESKFKMSSFRCSKSYTDTIEIAGAYLVTDGFGHNCGFYRINTDTHNTVTVRITDLTHSEVPFEEVVDNHSNDHNFKNITGYDGMAIKPFKIPLTTACMRYIQGGENDSYQVTAIAGDGFIQVNKQTSILYEFKSVALISYRGGSSYEPSRNKTLNMFHLDKDDNLCFTNMVEIMWNGQTIATCLYDETHVKDSGC